MRGGIGVGRYFEIESLDVRNGYILHGVRLLYALGKAVVCRCGVGAGNLADGVAHDVGVADSGATGGASKKVVIVEGKSVLLFPLTKEIPVSLEKVTFCFFCIAMIFNALQKSVLYQLFVIM